VNHVSALARALSVEEHGLHAVLDTELGEDVVDVRLHRGRRENQPTGEVVVRGPVGHETEDLSLPLGGASSLQSAHDAGEPFLGEPPSTAKPVELQLWTALAAKPEPVTVLVVPIMVKQRAVNLIYVHTLSGPPPAPLVTEITDLAQRIQTSYLRLIKQARGS